jgi:hypothetical protein
MVNRVFHFISLFNGHNSDAGITASQIYTFPGQNQKQYESNGSGYSHYFTSGFKFLKICGGKTGWSKSLMISRTGTSTTVAAGSGILF